MAKNDIYELTKLLYNQEGLENDIAEVLSMFQENLQKKYVKKIHATANAQQESVVEHPPKEVTLLRAMRAFTDDNGKQRMDNMIQTILMMNTVKKINDSVSDLSSSKSQLLQTMSSEGTSAEQISEEADIPEGSAKMTGLLLTLALANII